MYFFFSLKATQGGDPPVGRRAPESPGHRLLRGSEHEDQFREGFRKIGDPNVVP